MNDSHFKAAPQAGPGFLNRHVFRMLAGGLALLGSATLLLTTRWGIGLGGDSIAYIGVARNLLEGRGVVYFDNVGGLAPVTHYPPLYPLALAGVGLLGMDPLAGARWLGVIFFAGNIALASVIVYSSSLSFAASLLASFLVLTAFPMVQIHSMAWTEPMGIFFGFLGLLLLVRSLEGSKRFLFHLSSIFIGLSCLTRYAGLAFVLAGAIKLWFFDHRESGKRFVDVVCFCALSCLPLAAWSVRNAIGAGTAFHRTLGFYAVSTDDLVTAIDSFRLWLLPMEMPKTAASIIGLILAIAFLGACRTTIRGTFSNSTMNQLLGIFLLSYASFLIAARTVYDPAIIFDTRTLSPAYLAAAVLVISAVANVYKQTKLKKDSRSLRILNCSIIAVSVLQMTAGVAWMTFSFAEGVGYAGKFWRESKLVPLVESLKPTTPLFTNAPDVIYLYTGRLTDMIPPKLNPDTLAANERYPVQLASMKRKLQEEQGVLFYMKAESRLRYLPSEQELQNELPLRLIARVKAGNIYRITQ